MEELTKEQHWAREQVLLANERTLLAYLRTGITFILLGIAVLEGLDDRLSMRILGVSAIIGGAGFIVIGEILYNKRKHI